VGSISYILSGLYYQEIKNKTKNKLQKQKGISSKLKTYQIRNDYEMTALHGVVKAASYEVEVDVEEQMRAIGRQDIVIRLLISFRTK
jgi:hypothetical protein